MDNIFTALKPFLDVMRISGIFPFSFDGDPAKGVFKIKWQGVIATLCFILLLIATTYLNYAYKGFIASDSTVLDEAWYITINAEFLSHFLLLGYQILICKNILKFSHQIQAIDEEVKVN